MWTLIRAQLKGRWQWRLAAALLAGAGAAAFEFFYEGRGPSEWSVAVPLALIAGALCTCFFSNHEAMERRPTLLKTLPVTTGAIAGSTVLVPLLLFLPVVLVAIGLGWGFGVITGVGELRAMVVFAVLLWAILATGPLWAELKPRIVAWPYGRLVHYGLPFVVGGIAGAYGSARLKTLEGETITEALLRWMTPSLGIALAVLGLAMSALTLFLFVRREAYVD